MDNKAPTISLPASWFQWDTIDLDIQEEHSGLLEASLEISDPQGRGPARIIALDSATFPMQFKWDRRFADGTTAPEGKYDVKVTATDNLGNTAIENASITILLNLPPGPTAQHSNEPPTGYSHGFLHSYGNPGQYRHGNRRGQRLWFHAGAPGNRHIKTGNHIHAARHPYTK